MNEVIERPQANVEVQQTPMSIMALAIQQGASIESIERMWILQVKYEERLAEKAFVSAMAEFKQNPPTILKERHVKFGTTEYFHATHDAVTSAIIGGLSNHGISHRWDIDQKDGKIGVTCVLTHRGGHSQSTRLEAGYDASGGKNSIQSIISAKTYLERHTLLSATGLSTRDIEDDDGYGSGSPRDSGGSRSNDKPARLPPAPAGYFTEKRMQSWARSLGSGRTHQDLIDHLSSAYSLTQDDIVFINNIKPITE